jgi:hypothetical protein
MMRGVLIVSLLGGGRYAYLFAPIEWSTAKFETMKGKLELFAVAESCFQKLT